MTSRFELHAPSRDPEVPGGLHAFTDAESRVVKWVRDGGTAFDTKTGMWVGRNVASFPTTKTQEYAR